MINSSQSLASIGPLSEIYQITNYIFLIDLSMPEFPQKVFEKINMVSTINMNFSFTNPLSYLMKYSYFPPAYISESSGFNTYSLIYNLQSQIITFLAILSMLRMAKGVGNVKIRRNNIACQKITKWLQTLDQNKNQILHDVYYQQRMYIYFALYLFVSQFQFSDYLRHRKTLFLFEILTFLLITIADGYITLVWMKQIFTDGNKIDPYISIYKEFPVTKRFEYKWLHCKFLVMHIIFPLIIAHQWINRWIQVVLVTALLLALCLFMAFVVKFQHNKHLVICYFMNYGSLFIVCGIWIIYNIVCTPKNDKVVGSIIALLLMVPTIINGSLLLPPNMILMVKWIAQLIKKHLANCKNRCRNSSSRY